MRSMHRLRILSIFNIEHAAKLARDGICALAPIKASRVGAVIGLFVFFRVCR